jgi:hypothetical protein
MKKITFFTVVVIVLISTPAFSQLPKFLAPGHDAGYMGLWDMGGSVGFQNYKQHEILSDNSYQDTKSNGPLLLLHGQSSLLSNYYWSDMPDKRFKFGFVEKVEIGANYISTKVTTDSPFNPVPDPSSKIGLAFTIEQGAGGVFRINNKTDVGYTYYFYSISSFHDKSFDHSGYSKFRFRYSHLMAEVSAFGRNGIDIKYLRNKDEDRTSSSYYGFRYTGWKTQGPTSGNGSKTTDANQFCFSIGRVL